MILSVLIPSLIERADKYNFIYNRLNQLIDKNDLKDKVEIISFIDNREITTGEKRNILKDKAKGEYVCSIDDDDNVSDDYFNEIINGITISNADVITFLMNKYTDGELEYQNKFSKFITQGYLGGSKESKILISLPHHLCPHKRELADKISFPHKCFQEDYEYMLLLNKITKTEHHINKVLYTYNYVSGKY